MKKVNTKDVVPEVYYSPKRKFGMIDQNLSIALGRDPTSTDLMKRQPFDVAICRIPAGLAVCPYHSHSTAWEFYQVISGAGVVRDKDGLTPVGPGDAVIFAPNEPHQLIAGSSADLVVYVVADNPLGDMFYYPDSAKWAVHFPQRQQVRSEPLDYYDGEE